jgi:hypothetical protein
MMGQSAWERIIHIKLKISSSKKIFGTTSYKMFSTGEDPEDMVRLSEPDEHGRKQCGKWYG